MAMKLHRCGITWVNISAHPCYKVQKALDDAGVEYEVVKHPTFPRSKRTDVIELTGQNLLPVIELADGTVIRKESKDLIAMIEAGEVGEVGASAPAA